MTCDTSKQEELIARHMYKQKEKYIRANTAVAGLCSHNNVIYPFLVEHLILIITIVEQFWVSVPKS